MGRRREEQGQAIIVFVLFITVLLMFVAVVIDGGMYFVERRDMQGTADAAAMAAVRELPNVAEANNKAQEYATTQNAGSEGTLRSIDFSDAGRTVRVVVGKTGTQSFGALMGMAAPEIAASATARVQMMGPRPGMLPMAFMRDTFQIGQNYQVMFDNNATGNRGAIAPQMQPNCAEARGADDFRNLIIGSSRGGIDACATPLASTVDTEPGQMAGPVRQGLDARLSGNAQSFDEVFRLDPETGYHTIEDSQSPRIGIVPVIEHSNGSNVWPTGRSAPVRIIAYMLVYIGRQDSPPDYPAYTDNGRSVWVTPVRPILPEDFPDGEFVDYIDGSPSPVVFRLVD